MDEQRTLTIKGEGMARGQNIEIKELPMNKIKLGRNSRLRISNEDLSGLMASINSTGLLEPIGVMKSGDHFEIAYGNRRFMAFSRLGLPTIPYVIHEATKNKKVDVMNLAENIQRRQISLAEIGRYATLLQGEGLGPKELAVRLGVTVNYVNSCLTAFQEVPKEYREDLEVNIGGERKHTPGKITMTAAKAIINSNKSLNAGSVMQKALFKAAKEDERFVPENVPKYIAAMKVGKKDPIGQIKGVKAINLHFLVNQDEYDRLEKKYVLEGPFNTFSGLIKSILKGQTATSIKIID